MPREIDPHAAVDFIRDNAASFAQAKAERVYLEEFRKTKKAILMQAHLALPIGAQEREAYAHPEYAEVLRGLQAAVEAEEALRWQLVAAQARIDVWRSQESSARAEGRAVT